MHLSNKPSSRKPRAIRRWFVVGVVAVVVGLAAFGLVRYYTSPGMVLARLVKNLAEEAVNSQTYQAGANGGVALTNPLVVVFAGKYRAEVDVVRSFTPSQLGLSSRTGRVPFSALDAKQQATLRAVAALLRTSHPVAERIDASYLEFVKAKQGPDVTISWRVKTGSGSVGAGMGPLNGPATDVWLERLKTSLPPEAATDAQQVQPSSRGGQ